MAWVKLDDGFFRNPKILEISPESKLIYLAGLCYAGASLTDGFIPKNAVRILGSDAGVSASKRRVDELLSAGLWVENPRGYSIHDYLEHNQSADSVRANREAARERMSRKRSGEVRANNKRGSGEVREPDTDTDTDFSPSGEIGGDSSPEKPQDDPKPKSKPKRATQVPDDFAVTDALISWANDSDEQFTVQEMQSQVPRFVAHHKAKGTTYKDWHAAFQNWMRNALDFGHLNRAPDGTLRDVSRGQGGNSGPGRRGYTAGELLAMSREENVS